MAIAADKHKLSCRCVMVSSPFVRIALNVSANNAVPTAAYKRLILFRGGRHGTSITDFLIELQHSHIK